MRAFSSFALRQDVLFLKYLLKPFLTFENKTNLPMIDTSVRKIYKKLKILKTIPFNIIGPSIKILPESPNSV